MSRLLALHTNIRLGWKGLLGTNALAYYEKSQLTSVKSFVTLTPGVALDRHKIPGRSKEVLLRDAETSGSWRSRRTKSSS